jgi:hypothetical protein
MRPPRYIGEKRVKNKKVHGLANYFVSTNISDLGGIYYYVVNIFLYSLRMMWGGHPPHPCCHHDKSCQELWAMAVGSGGGGNCNGERRRRQGKQQWQGDQGVCGS